MVPRAKKKQNGRALLFPDQCLLLFENAFAEPAHFDLHPQAQGFVVIRFRQLLAAQPDKLIRRTGPTENDSQRMRPGKAAVRVPGLVRAVDIGRHNGNVQFPGDDSDPFFKFLDLPAHAPAAFREHAKIFPIAKNIRRHLHALHQIAGLHRDGSERARKLKNNRQFKIPSVSQEEKSKFY